MECIPPQILKWISERNIFSVRKAAISLGINYDKCLETAENDTDMAWQLFLLYCICRAESLQAYFNGHISRDEAAQYIEEAEQEINSFTLPTTSFVDEPSGE